MPPPSARHTQVIWLRCPALKKMQHKWESSERGERCDAASAWDGTSMEQALACTIISQQA